MHPNDEALEYVWDKFAEAILTKESLNLNRDLDKLFLSFNHKAFIENSIAYKCFLEKTMASALALNEKVDLKEEIKELKKRIQ